MTSSSRARTHRCWPHRPDLGPAREQSIQLTASLTDQSEPQALIDWARAKALSIQWRPGDDWVVVEGSPDAVERAFDVSVRDYRGRKASIFYASPHQKESSADETP